MTAVLGNLRPVDGNGKLVGGDPAQCARVLGVDGLAVSLLAGEGLAELVWCSPGPSAQLEDLQFTLGLGPGPETAASCAPVLEADLSRVPDERWPGLLSEAMALGVGAVFCLPLHIGGACVGTMTLQRTKPGPLSPTGMGDALILAGALTAVVLEGGEAQGAFADAESNSVLYRAAVHQATGMISVQAGVPLAQALLRLRAYAFRHGQPVVEAAEDVVARRVHFRHDGNEPDSSGSRRG